MPRLVRALVFGPLLLGTSYTAVAEGKGAFPKPLIVDMSTTKDGRTVRLVQPFSFTDSRGRDWFVPSGTVVDGASIPKVFWSLIGGPFEGRYREASVIHDYYCQTRSRSSAETHEAFYDAMLTAGENEKKAKLMYLAVYRFGPTWTEGAWLSGEKGTVRFPVDGSYNADEFARLKSLVEDQELSLAQIRELADEPVAGESWSDQFHRKARKPR